MNHRYLPHVSFKLEWISVETERIDKLIQKYKDKENITKDEQFEWDKLELRSQEIKGWWKQIGDDMTFLRESPFGGDSYDEDPTPLDRIVMPKLKEKL